MKTALKQSVKAAALAAGRAWRVRRTGVRILTYHSVGRRSHEMNVTPAAFREQMQWLAKETRVIPLEKVPGAQEGIAITFDDGYRDNLLEAAPILCELGLPATVFVVAGRAGGLLAHDHDPATAYLMTWDEVRALDSLGIAIGSHTLTHARLALLDEDRQQREIVDSKRIIEKELGHPIVAFAYPYGSRLDFNKTSHRLVRDSGYSLAVSNQYGVNPVNSDPFALRRIWIDSTDTFTLFRSKVNGDLDLLVGLDSTAGIWMRRALNRVVNRP